MKVVASSLFTYVILISIPWLLVHKFEEDYKNLLLQILAGNS